MRRGGCFSADQILSLAEGHYPALELASALAHMDGCAPCRQLLVEAMRWPDDGPAAPLLMGRRVFADGDVVASRYEVIGFIGRGGMGEVYRVTDTELQRRIALKTVSSFAAAGGTALSRLRREAQLAQLIAHPNVCRVFDFGEHTGDHGTVPFLTMELVEGVTVAQRLRDGPLSPDEIRAIVTGIAAGLAAAHEASVIHRDLTPRNVVLPDAGNGSAPGAVVMDFGLARPAVPARDWGASMSEAGAMPGTPAYIAPEQILGYEATPAVDIYAFGVLFYELIAGKLPFEGPPMVMASRRLVEDPAPLVAPPGIPAGWKSLVAQCLRRDPRERPRSFELILRALEGDESAVRTARRWLSRRGAAVVGGLGAAAAISAAVFFANARSKSPPPTAAVPIAPLLVTPPAPPDRSTPDRRPQRAVLPPAEPAATTPAMPKRGRTRSRGTVVAAAPANRISEPAPAPRSALGRDEIIDAFATPQP
jgi:protein kinase-like protein